MSKNICRTRELILWRKLFLFGVKIIGYFLYNEKLKVFKKKIPSLNLVGKICVVP